MRAIANTIKDAVVAGLCRANDRDIARGVEALKDIARAEQENGKPLIENQSFAEKIADLVGYQNRAPMTWKHVERYRELWKGNFVLKGVMHPDDAIRAHALGVDGLMVSNHGARQLDNAPSPLEVLPAVNAAVGDKMTLMLDGGVRRGLAYGATDDFGYAAVENVCTVHDLHATMLHQLGIRHDAFSVKFQGLDARLTGVEAARVLTDILA